MTDPQSSAWRKRFKVHPAADVFPMMTAAELDETGADIKANGLKQPVDIRRLYGSVLEVLDGRNRLEAMEQAGIAARPEDFRELKLDDAGAVLHIMSMNVHRRHLSPEQKRQVIAALLKADPTQSNRQIAKVAHADDKTVGKQRAKDADFDIEAEIDIVTDKLREIACKRQPKTNGATKADIAPLTETELAVAKLNHEMDMVAEAAGIDAETLMLRAFEAAGSNGLTGTELYSSVLGRELTVDEKDALLAEEEHSDCVELEPDDLEACLIEIEQGHLVDKYGHELSAAVFRNWSPAAIKALGVHRINDDDGGADA